MTDIADATDSDLEAACRIAAESLDLDQGESTDLPRPLWREDEGTTRVRLLAVTGSEPVGVAIGSIQGEEAFLDLIAVVPSARNAGVARRLLTEWERRATGTGAIRLRAGENTRTYGWPGVDVRYTPGLCLLRRFGYERTNTVYNMDLSLEGFRGPSEDQVERLAAAGIEVRRARHEDRDALAQHVRRLWPDIWLRETGIAVERETPPLFLALRDGQIVGFAGHGIYRPSFYGPIATDPAEQRHGVGAVLSALALADMASRDVKTAQIGWVAETAIPFYSRTSGARLGRCFWMLAKTIDS